MERERGFIKFRHCRVFGKLCVQRTFSCNILNVFFEVWAVTVSLSPVKGT